MNSLDFCMLEKVFYPHFEGYFCWILNSQLIYIFLFKCFQGVAPTAFGLALFPTMKFAIIFVCSSAGDICFSSSECFLRFLLFKIITGFKKFYFAVCRFFFFFFHISWTWAMFSFLNWWIFILIKFEKFWPVFP